MEPLGPDLERQLDRLSGSRPLAELVRSWPGLVGEAIARNAWPARFGRDGTLYVHTSSSAWAFELTQLASQVCERLREGLGDGAPAQLRFRPGPLPEAPAGTSPHLSRRAPAISPEDRERAVELARGIEDGELRELVARAAAASLAAAASDRRF
ncbi:MAG: DUF721 domain-containing protein [Gaiellaceae bacterium]